MKTIEAVEQKASKIEDDYYLKISPLEKEKKQLDVWLRSKPKTVKIPEEEMVKARERAVFLTKEIIRLKKEKRGRILKIYQKNKLVARSLEELNRIREGDFKKKSSNFNVTTTTEAHSEKLKEGAYYCRHCKLWIVGSARNGHLPQDFYGPWDYYFCMICDSIVGETEFEIRRMIDESYRP